MKTALGRGDAEAVRRLFARYDPAGAVTRDDAEWRASLDLITAQPPAGDGEKDHVASTSPRRPVLRRVAAAAAGIAVIAAGSVVLHNTRETPSHTAATVIATPVLLAFHTGDTMTTGSDALLKAAASAQEQPDTTGDGRYQYVKTQGWYLNTAVSRNVGRSAVVPVLRQQWLAADGSGRLSTQPQPPYFPSADDKQAWEAAGEPGPAASDETLRAGGLHMTWSPGSLSTDVTVLREQLAEGHPADLGPAETLVAISDLYKEQPVAPAIRAAILRLVATLPGLRYDGTTTDRAGRAGIGVSVDADFSGLPTRYLLVFDSTSGQLLDSEQILTTSAGSLGVPIPSVVSYTLYLQSTRTDNLAPPA